MDPEWAARPAAQTCLVSSDASRGRKGGTFIDERVPARCWNSSIPRARPAHLSHPLRALARRLGTRPVPCFLPFLRENVAEQPATEAAPVGLEEKPALGGDEEPAAQEDAPPEEDDVNDPPPADRTNIVRPSGRTIWIQRDGHDTLELSGMRLSVGRDPKCEIVIASLNSAEASS